MVNWWKCHIKNIKLPLIFWYIFNKIYRKIILISTISTRSSKSFYTVKVSDFLAESTFGKIYNRSKTDLIIDYYVFQWRLWGGGCGIATAPQTTKIVVPPQQVVRRTPLRGRADQTFVPNFVEKKMGKRKKWNSIFLFYLACFKFKLN